ncbi:MAG: tetratricopeptide repeat protein [Verrucomicrobia bacterium]|nr:tetratricopeptide repeat protein [Verrucomicrobiota bacterium]
MRKVLVLLMAGVVLGLGIGPAAASAAADADDAESNLAELELERLNAIIGALEVLDAKGDTAGMIDLYRKGMLLSPSDVSARERYASIGLGLIAHVLATKGDMAQVLDLIDEFEVYVGEDFALPSALSWLRVAALRRLDRTEDAAAAQQKAIEYKTDDTDYRRQVGYFLLRAGLYDEAIAEFESALAHTDDAWYRAIFARGIAAAYLMTEQYAKAADEYEKALVIHSDGRFPRAYGDLIEDACLAMYHLGRDFELRGKYAETVAANERALKLLPDPLDEELGQVAATNLTAIADAYLKLKKPNDALPYADRAKRAAPNAAGAYSTLGDVHAALGKKNDADAAYAECERLYREMIDTDPDHAMASNNLAWFYVTHDRELDEALKLVRKALELAPETEAYLDTLAEIYFRQGEIDQAVETIARVFELEPTPHHILYFEQQRDKFTKARKRGS